MSCDPNPRATLVDGLRRAAAQALAEGDAARAGRIADHVAHSAQYFPLDEQGQPRKPSSPFRVLWGAD